MARRLLNVFAMARVLILTDCTRTEAVGRLGLNLLGVSSDVARSLGDAMRRLQATNYDAAVVDLQWERDAADTLASWVRAHLVARGIPLVIGASTPLSQDLEAVVRIPSGVFLRREFDLLDLKEALEPLAVPANGTAA